MSDIHELFARDPLSYSAADLETIITELRKSRHQFSLGNKTAGKVKPPSAKQAQADEFLKGIDIDL